MKIAYLGNFGPIHSTETHVGISLEDLGHTVIRLQEDRYDWTMIRTMALTTDLFLWTRTWRRDDAGALETLKALADAKVPTVSAHLDLYFAVHRENQIDSEPFWKTKYVFTADGGHQAEFAQKGIRHFWMQPAVFGRECVREAPVDRYKCEVLFVGSYNYHKEHYRKELIDWLRATYGGRFAHWGHSPATTIRNLELNRLYASAAVIVGDSCNPGFQLTHYWSDRIPETLGRGGFLLHPEVVGLDQYYTPGVHFARYTFGDFAGLRQTIDRYLACPEEREKIRAAGHAHVRQHHTYAHRMAEVLETVAREERR